MQFCMQITQTFILIFLFAYVFLSLWIFMYQTWLVDNKLNILTVIMELFSKITDPYRIIKFMVIKKLQQNYSISCKKLAFLLIVLFLCYCQPDIDHPHKSVKCPNPHHKKRVIVDELDQLLVQNFQMVCKQTRNDPFYFKRHATGQKPKFLWIGCSDSRVIPEHMVGAKIGDLFVHRNIANQVNQLDQNAMSVLQYAIEYLQINNIVIVGHYECGGIKASLLNKSFGHLQSWLSQIRRIKARHSSELKKLPQSERFRRLVQINVQEQVKRVSRVPLVHHTWSKGKKLNIIGLVYDIQTGLLNNVTKPIRGVQDLPVDQEVFIQQ